MPKKGQQSDRDRKKTKPGKEKDSGNKHDGGKSKPGSSKQSNSTRSTTKVSQEKEVARAEIKSRPRIDISADTLASLKHVLKTFEELDKKPAPCVQTAAGLEFAEKFQNNLEANAAVSSKHATDDLVDCLADLYLERRDPVLDSQLLKEFERKKKEQYYIKMKSYRETLPAYDCKAPILDLLTRNQAVVICGETGSGKTTQVCQFILDDAIAKGEGSTCKILCTQPRRISAISVAERVADERAERVGSSIGYSIRLEARLPSKAAGTVTFVTTGVVFQYLKSDPNLSKVSHVIVDEVHERDILTDFLLVILRDLIARRPDLKIILMSATMNAKKFSDYFDKCAIYGIPGFLHEVQEEYLEDILQRTRFMFPIDKRAEAKASSSNSNKFKSKELMEFEEVNIRAIKNMELRKLYPPFVLKELRKPCIEGKINFDLIQELIMNICEKDTEGLGAILVFMPGWDTISGMSKQLQSCGRFPANKYLVIPLHSQLPSSNQREVFNKPPAGKRKIIIATNIAETSITIDDVVHVIDTGRVKINNFDIKRNMETLDLEWIGRANRRQRKGRAGRVQKGFCYYLYTKAREEAFEEYKKPEILRKRLEEVILQIKMLKLGMAGPFLKKMLDAPSTEAVDHGIKFLQNLGALDPEENLTPLGFHLAHLPMDPQTGKMILMGALFSCVDPIFSIAASLSFKDAFYTPMGRERAVDQVKLAYSDSSKSDHMVMVRAIKGYEAAKGKGTEWAYCREHYLSMNTINMLINLKSQFAKYLYAMKFLPSLNYKDESVNRNWENTGIITALTVSGLYPNVAQIFGKGKGAGRTTQVFTQDDGVVSIHMKSVNSKERDFEWPYLVYHQKMKTNFIYLFDTTMVSPFPLVFFGGNLQYNREKGHGWTISIDNNRIRLSCEKTLMQTVDALRQELDKFLEYKIRNPGPTNWGVMSRERTLLTAIIKLITAEYNMFMGDSDSEDSDLD